MRCIRCGKLLLGKPGAVVPGQHAGEPYAWGPKCAVIAGLVKPKHSAPKIAISTRARIGQPGQIDWVAELC